MPGAAANRSHGQSDEPGLVSVAMPGAAANRSASFVACSPARKCSDARCGRKPQPLSVLAPNES